MLWTFQAVFLSPAVWIAAVSPQEEEQSQRNITEPYCVRKKKKKQLQGLDIEPEASVKKKKKTLLSA